MGSDAIKPFLDQGVARNKSAFGLAKTSNPSSVELQDMVAGDRVVYTVMGDLIERWGKDTAGKYGYNALGAVVGAAGAKITSKRSKALSKACLIKALVRRAFK